jgi:hypothetical protein
MIVFLFSLFFCGWCLPTFQLGKMPATFVNLTLPELRANVPMTPDNLLITQPNEIVTKRFLVFDTLQIFLRYLCCLQSFSF